MSMNKKYFLFLVVFVSLSAAYGQGLVINEYKLNAKASRLNFIELKNTGARSVLKKDYKLTINDADGTELVLGTGSVKRRRMMVISGGQFQKQLSELKTLYLQKYNKSESIWEVIQTVEIQFVPEPGAMARWDEGDFDTTFATTPGYLNEFEPQAERTVERKLFQLTAASTFTKIRTSSERASSYSPVAGWCLGFRVRRHFYGPAYLSGYYSFSKVEYGINYTTSATTSVVRYEYTSSGWGEQKRYQFGEELGIRLDNRVDLYAAGLMTIGGRSRQVYTETIRYAWFTGANTEEFGTIKQFTPATFNLTWKVGARATIWKTIQADLSYEGDQVSPGKIANGGFGYGIAKIGLTYQLPVGGVYRVRKSTGIWETNFMVRWLLRML